MVLSHPLVPLFAGLARGIYPPNDGLTEAMPCPSGTEGAILGFTGHHVIAADIDTDWVARRCRPGDLLAPASPAFVLELAEQLGVAPSSTRLVLRAPADEGKPDLPLDPVIQGSAIPALLARNAIGPRYRCMQRRTDTRS